MLGTMVESIQSPAQVTYWLITGRTLFLLVNLLGLACFFYIAARRILPLMRSQRDSRFDRPLVRLERLLQFWLGQWKHPRYRTAGSIHILIFAGFLTLATQSGQIFDGWWQHTGDLMRTVVASPSPAPPILLHENIAFQPLPS
jgi:hypothetical protein